MCAVPNLGCQLVLCVLGSSRDLSSCCVCWAVHTILMCVVRAVQFLDVHGNPLNLKCANYFGFNNGGPLQSVQPQEFEAGFL